MAIAGNIRAEREFNEYWRKEQNLKFSKYVATVVLLQTKSIREDINRKNKN